MMKQLTIIFVSILSLTIPLNSKAYDLPFGYLLAENSKQKAQPMTQTENIVNVPSNKRTEYLYKLLLAEIALSRSQPDIALTNYIWVAKETQDGRVAKRATQIAMAMGSLEHAEEAATIWARSEPKNLEAQITSGAILIRAEKPTESVEALERVQKITPLDANEHFMILYKQLQETNDKKNVIEALKLLAKKQPKQYAAQLALGEIYLLTGKNAEALKISDEILTINPRIHTALILHIEALIANNETDKALNFLEKSIKNNKDNLLLKQYYVEYLFKQGQGEKAYNEVKILTESAANLPAQYLLNLARLSMEAKWYPEAETFLKQAAKDENYEQATYYFLARLYESKEKPLDSIEWYQKVQSGPFHIISYIRASMLLADLKRYDEALELITKAQPTTHEDLKQLSITQTEILAAANRPLEAINLLNTHLKLLPHDTDLLYSRGIMYERLGKVGLAEKDLSLILKTNPNHVEALNALGYILATNTTRYKEAQALLEKALKLAPNNPSVLDSMGWLQFKMGQHEEAIKNLKKALSITPNPEIAAHLGEVLWDMKKHDEALKVWRDALKTNPNHQSIMETMHRFIGNNSH